MRVSAVGRAALEWTNSRVFAAPSTTSDVSVEDRLRATRARLLDLRSALMSFRTEASGRLGSSRTVVASAASVTSSTAVPLDLSGTPTTLRSIEEVNASPFSFTPFGPSVVGGRTTSLVTIDGEYDGDQGTDTITFKFKDVDGNTDVVGAEAFKVEVRDSSNFKFDEIVVGSTDPPGTIYTLNNGLTVSFSAGEVGKNETFTVDVTTAIGAAVDPTKPLDGTRLADASLQHGLTVADGSFELNGVTIEVDASSSLLDILDAITTSGAGVTATFDAASEQVVLTQNQDGPQHTITIANDTSGAVAALKLEGAVAQLGEPPETQQALAEVGAFSSISSGTITVNGTEIAIDVGTDSLDDVLERITAAGAGVTAAFDPGSRKVTIASLSSTGSVDLDSGTTAFFAAVNITDGAYDPKEEVTITPGGMGRARSARSADLLIEARDLLAVLWAPPESGAELSALERMRDRIRDVIRDAFDMNGDVVRTRWGLSFDLGSESASPLRLDAQGARRLAAVLRKPHDDGARDLLLGTGRDGDTGLVGGLLTAIDTTVELIESRLGSIGQVFDLAL